MENRRDFLKKLGLTSLLVASGTSPIIASAVDKGIESNITTPEEFLNTKIEVWRFKIQKGIENSYIVSNAYSSKNECELHSLINTELSFDPLDNYIGWEEYGGQVCMELSNFAYRLATKFDTKTWRAEEVGNYIKSTLPEIYSEWIPLKEYINQLSQDPRIGGIIIN